MADKIVIKPVSGDIVKNKDLIKTFIKETERDIIRTLAKRSVPMTTFAIRADVIRSLVIDAAADKVIPLDSVDIDKIQALKYTGPLYKTIHSMEKVLKSHNVKVANYSAYESALDGLFAWGLVGKRYTAFKGAKFLWFLNPAALKLLDYPTK